MDPNGLSAKLAGALDQIVPEPFRVYDYDGTVIIEGGPYRTGSEVADIVNQEGDDMEHAWAVAWNALSSIQDHIAETLTTPWPGTATDLPLPQVEVTETQIRMWFEDDAGKKVLEAPTVPW